MNDNAAQLWNEVLLSLKQFISAQSFETWIKPTKALELSETSLVVEVPNKFFKDWLTDHYLDLINETVFKSLSRPLQIEFVVAKNVPFVADNPASSAKQVPDTFLNPKYTFESFVVGPSNRFAHAASFAVSESPARAYNPLFIYGGVGLGKTHLLQAVGHSILEKNKNAKLNYSNSEKFTNQLINAIQTRTTMRFREKYRSVDVLLLDDIQFIAGKESTQEEFFHTFNTLYDAHKQIIISSDRHPKEIPGLEERLISRFEWGLVTDIQPPDLETRIAILKKKAEREIVKVPDEVLFFIAEKIRSNIRELEGALIRVVAYSLLTSNPISVALTGEVLKDTIKEDASGKTISIENIQKAIAENFDIRVADIKKSGRSKIVSHPRQLAMYLSRHLTNYSFAEIGEYFGGRDHTTVLHAYEKIKRLTGKDKKLNELLTTIINKLKNS